MFLIKHPTKPLYFLVAIIFLILVSIFLVGRHEVGVYKGEIHKLNSELAVMSAQVMSVQKMSDDAMQVLKLVRIISGLNENYPRQYGTLLTPKQVSEITTSIILAYKEHGIFGLTIPLICGLIDVESGFKPNAISTHRAHGLTQLLPTTAYPYVIGDGFKFNESLLLDHEWNIRWGCRYLIDLHKVYMSENLESKGDFTYSLTNYYWGERVVRIYLANGKKEYPKDIMEYQRKVISAKEKWEGWLLSEMKK